MSQRRLREPLSPITWLAMLLPAAALATLDLPCSLPGSLLPALTPSDTEMESGTFINFHSPRVLVVSGYIITWEIPIIVSSVAVIRLEAIRSSASTQSI